MNNAYRKTFRYLLYLLLILAYSSSFSMIQLKLEEYASIHFAAYRVTWILYLLYFIGGMLLALPHTAQQIKKEGSWSINWLIILILVIPLTIFSFLPYIAFLLHGYAPNWLLSFLFKVTDAWNSLTLIGAGLLFCYSIYKK